MASQKKRLWLVAYDVADRRRLQRLRRRLLRDALPVQYSLYLFHGSAGEVHALLDALVRLMDEAEDDVRAYPVPERPELVVMGRSGLPEGVGWYAPALREVIRLLQW